MNITYEDVCRYTHSINGASPLWCMGSSVIARVGDDILCTVPQGGFGVLPMSDRHIELYRKRPGQPFELLWREDRFTREPAPVVVYDDKTIVMTANPAIKRFKEGEGEKTSPSEPLIYTFDITKEKFEPEITKPLWDDPGYLFYEHSYRNHCIDRSTGELLLTWQYVKDNEGAHCYSLRNKNGEWIRSGKLEYPKRACYQNLALKNNSAHIFGVSDVIEPVLEWKEYKQEITGKKWDYDFRNLYYIYSNDIYRDGLSDAMIIDSREETCGYMFNLDICVDDSGQCHMLYKSKSIWHEFIRDKFFPDVDFDAALHYCKIKDGKIIEQKIIDKETELTDRKNVDTNYQAAFHEGKDGRIQILMNKNNSNGTGKYTDGWYLLDSDMNAKRLDIGAEPGAFHSAKSRLGNMDKDHIDILMREKDMIKYIGIEL